MASSTLRMNWLRPLVALVLLGSACHDGSTGDGAAPSVAVPTLSVSPSTSATTTRQSLSVSVTVAGSNAAVPDGSVVLTSGSFSSGAIQLAQGRATIGVPAGVLAIGSDSLAVAYTPSNGAAATYASATGAATVVVSDGGGTNVTATSTSFPTYGHPFQALPIGSDLFVSTSANTTAGSQTGIRVYSAATPLQPAYRCTQASSHPNHQGVPYAFGLAATPDGASLLAAEDDAGVAAFARSSLAAGCGSSEVLVPQGSIASAQGTFAVTVTPDGKFAFVANEYGVAANDANGKAIQGNVGVVALDRDASGAVSGGRLVGQFSTGGQAIANVTLSPDGTRLYVTSEIAAPGAQVSGTSNAILAHGGCTQGTDANGAAVTSGYGILSIVDVAKAEAAPTAAAIIATVAAGCSPVRVVETGDGQVVWVAARGDDRVLAFSTHMLEANPGAALLGYGDTGGVAPVGLQLLRGDTLLAVANSNRFSSPAAVGNMTLLNATPVRPTVARTVAASYFPRSVAVAADGTTLYLTDYDGGIVQVVATSVN